MLLGNVLEFGRDAANHRIRQVSLKRAFVAEPNGGGRRAASGKFA